MGTENADVGPQEVEVETFLLCPSVVSGTGPGTSKGHILSE